MCDYKAFQPCRSERVRENIEWSIAYSYNALDRANPRILLIGDSICHQYHDKVRLLLADRANISYWASSKCVTDPDYFRELSFHLDAYPYQMVCFNNGAHSLTTDPKAWQEAYEAALSFLQARLPGAKLSLTLCTALNDPEKNEKLCRLNGIAAQIGQERGLPLIDLYTPTQAMDKEKEMSDLFHYKDPAKAVQAEIVARHICRKLGLTAGTMRQNGTLTGPDGQI